MTRIFNADGSAIPVTVIQAGPCPVVAVRTRQVEGYDAIQIGFGEKRAKLSTKAGLGHAKKAGLESVRFLREVRSDEPVEAKGGDVLKADLFHEGEKVDVIGISRGMGLQAS